jgi:hypothetical protein
MNSPARRLLALEGIDPTRAHWQIVGRILYLAEGQKLFAVDLSDLSLVWRAEIPKPLPRSYTVPRRSRAGGRNLWVSVGRILHLVDTEEGVRIRALDALTGRTEWERDFPTPPPLCWTEPRPVCEGARTEEIDAFLLRDPPEAAVVAQARTTRRSEISTAQARFPRPPFHAQLELVRLDPASGRPLWSAALPEVAVPILRKDTLSSWFLRGEQLLGIDLATGRVFESAQVPKPSTWPVARGTDLLLGWRSTREVGVSQIERATGTLVKRSSWMRKRIHTVLVKVAPAGLALGLNDSFVTILDDALQPLVEHRMKGYVYDVASCAEGPIVVATAGHGGALYLFDPRSGEKLLEHPLPQGAWQLAVVDDSGLLAAACGPGVAWIDTGSRTVQVGKLRQVARILGASERRAVVLAGDEQVGIHLVEP